jgi:hypothetical protein
VPNIIWLKPKISTSYSRYVLNVSLAGVVIFQYGIDKGTVSDMELTGLRRVHIF